MTRVRQAKQTYVMKAHVVQQVEDELLHIHGDFSLSGAHGCGVRCSPSGSSVAAIIVKICLFLSTRRGASLGCTRRRRPSDMTGTWTAGKGCSSGFRVWTRDWQLFAVKNQRASAHHRGPRISTLFWQDLRKGILNFKSGFIWSRMETGVALL